MAYYSVDDFMEDAAMPEDEFWSKVDEGTIIITHNADDESLLIEETE